LNLKIHHHRRSLPLKSALSQFNSFLLSTYCFTEVQCSIFLPSTSSCFHMPLFWMFYNQNLVFMSCFPYACFKFRRLILLVISITGNVWETPHLDSKIVPRSRYGHSAVLFGVSNCVIGVDERGGPYWPLLHDHPDILGGICLCEPSGCFMLCTLFNWFFRLLLGFTKWSPKWWNLKLASTWQSHKSCEAVSFSWWRHTPRAVY
jgi:hypothetical protein